MVYITHMLPIREILVNPADGRFRALWRILLQALIILAIAGPALVGIAETATWILKSGRIDVAPELFDKAIDMIAGVLLTCLVLLGLALGGRWLDRRVMPDFGFRMGAQWWREYAAGFLLGSVLMTIVFAVEAAAGWAEIGGVFHVSAAGVPPGLAFAYPVVKASCVGVYEEAVSRGYLVTNLREGMSGYRRLGERGAVIGAVVISSVFFGALHAVNPNATTLGTVSLMITGAFFAAAYVLTGRLGMCIGLHMSWNLFQGMVFGFPVSGDPEIAVIVHTQQHGPAWITGGSFGPEGGLMGLAASIAGMLLLPGVGRVLASDSDGRTGRR